MDFGFWWSETCRHWDSLLVLVSVANDEIPAAGHYEENEAHLAHSLGGSRPWFWQGLSSGKGPLSCVTSCQVAVDEHAWKEARYMAKQEVGESQWPDLGFHDTPRALGEPS